MKSAPFAGVLIASLAATLSASMGLLHHEDPALRAPADESGLAASVRTALVEQRHKLSHGTLESIHIEARGGVVHLQGDVPTSVDRLLVFVLSRNVDGVLAVWNELTVSSEDPPIHRGAGS